MSMKMLLVSATLALVLSLGVAQTAAASDADPVLGTWKLDASKSTFKAGPAIKSQTRTYTQSGDQITLEMKTVAADGKETTTHTTYQLNGKSFPVSGTPDYDSLSAKQVNANKASFTLKKAGKVIGTTTRTVSKDGKTLTSTSKMTTASGEASENRLVFEKQ
jgi:hypothetical protein